MYIITPSYRDFNKFIIYSRNPAGPSKLKYDIAGVLFSAFKAVDFEIPPT